MKKNHYSILDRKRFSQQKLIDSKKNSDAIEELISERGKIQ